MITIFINALLEELFKFLPGINKSIRDKQKAIILFSFIFSIFENVVYATNFNDPYLYLNRFFLSTPIHLLIGIKYSEFKNKYLLILFTTCIHFIYNIAILYHKPLASLIVLLYCQFQILKNFGLFQKNMIG